ncbi:longitudinals lacking protein, isoforms H/M/V isoform X9 [Hermetia illucens]|uniref:longitudinals lacking protein, isoforms H/M/V isoform X9 n=1 Tax=Hermetia illucens TaxID=343691 RepID=UPI0018CC3B5E|nr:longitudinals lacking protein, isoforms H/M/V isoform X9 [Hermetia illucens]
MDDDQQFCLRWNNHQSTLISVFDTLLENGTLVDCTLAAEGKFLKAHKVVLSACSPYFATLLSQQYDKHPIFILKDVKFQELRAMMDYMYRGEVNISQDQLAALLKAAESLQIKGLSDSRGGASSAVSGSAGICASQKSDHKALSVPVTSGPIKSNSPSGGYTIEQKRPRHAVGASSSIESQAGSREGSSSPTSRKRKRIRRRSMDNLTIDNHEHSNSSSQSMQINSSVAPSNTSTAMGSVPSSVAVSQAIVTQQTGAVAGTSGIVTAGTNTGLNVTKKTDSVSSNAKLEGAEQEVDNDNGDEEDESGKLANMRKEQNKRKQHTSDVDQKDSGGEILIEPKSEYDDGNDETVEDLTLDDEELLEDLEQAGPSHGGGEGSSQGYAQWQVERSQDDVFMATQESAGQQRDPQDVTTLPTYHHNDGMLQTESSSHFVYSNINRDDANQAILESAKLPTVPTTLVKQQVKEMRKSYFEHKKLLQYPEISLIANDGEFLALKRIAVLSSSNPERLIQWPCHETPTSPVTIIMTNNGKFDIRASHAEKPIYVSLI